MQHLQYNPSQCIECGECLLCPIEAISSVSPLSISAYCIDCEQCIAVCPKGEKVLRIAHNDELGGGWVSPFGYQASTNPSEPKKDDSENPSKPSEAESSTGAKDNWQDSSNSKGDSSQESSSAESKSDSTYTPAQKAQLESLKNALISAPPPYKIQASIKVINAIDSLRQYLSTMS